MKRGQAAPKKRISSRFKFYKRTIEIVIGNPVRIKLIDVQCLGDFGYHRLERVEAALEGAAWTITHIPSGLVACRVQTEKDAKILCKRLLVKVKHKWEPTREERISYCEFNDEVLSIINTHRESRVAPQYKTHTINPEDYDDDIPF